MRALVTGFEPFGGDRINASLEAVRRLPSRLGPLEIAVATLPASYARALSLLDDAISTARPGIVLCVGQAGERTALGLERVAINVQDAAIADNDGVRPVDAPVVAGGPPTYFSTLPIKAAVAALQAAGLPAEVSNSAGTFVCNHVFYGLMHFAAGRGNRFRAGFLHVPQLPQQAARQSNAESMTLDDIARGIAIVLEVSASHAEDLNSR